MTIISSIINTLRRWLSVVGRSLGMIPSAVAMADITTVYYFPIDHQGNETGEAIPVTLKPDGTADVSKLPTSVKERLETFGVRDPLHIHNFFPQEGKRFLNALLHISTGYTRFRTNPQPIAKKPL